MYTDGACLGNPGPGGWAWAVPGGRWRSGAAARTTNQRMEISAALDAARALEGPLEVVSDSTYVVNCFRDGWWQGWLARGWVGASKQKVANRDLWEPLVELYRSSPGRLHFRWVKGHGADPFNDLVDRLAVAAATAQRGGEGLRPPPAASVGPADVPSARPVPARAGSAGGRPAREAGTALRAAGDGAGGRPAREAGIALRSAGDDDVEAVLRLWQDAGPARAHRRRRQRAPADGPRPHGPDRGRGGAGGELVGTLVAGFDGWRAQLHRLVVHPQWRRRGLGLALVEEAERRLVAEGARRAAATVVLEDAHALSFWQAAGYTAQLGTRRHVKNLAGPGA